MNHKKQYINHMIKTSSKILPNKRRNMERRTRNNIPTNDKTTPKTKKPRRRNDNQTQKRTTHLKKN